jgi:hypothetical protein
VASIYYPRRKICARKTAPPCRMQNRPPGLDRESVQNAVERAKTELHTFNAKERVEYIRKMVACIHTYRSHNRSVEEIKGLLPEFYEQYKNLFEMVTAEEGYDESNLNTMLAMLQHMDKGNLSQHEASVVVGKRLYEKFGKKE